MCRPEDIRPTFHKSKVAGGSRPADAAGGANDDGDDDDDDGIDDGEVSEWNLRK